MLGIFSQNLQHNSGEMPGASSATSITSQQLRSNSYLSEIPYVEEVEGIKEIAVS